MTRAAQPPEMTAKNRNPRQGLRKSRRNAAGVMVGRGVPPNNVLQVMPGTMVPAMQPL